MWRVRPLIAGGAAIPSVELTWRLSYGADSDLGCVDAVTWEIYRDGALLDTLSTAAPEYTFPQAGSYQVALRIGGLGGEGEAAQDLDVQPTGCAHAAAPAGAAWLLAALVGLRRSRRGYW